MSALVRKEIRLILPAWALAMLLATVPVWLLWPMAHGNVPNSPGFLVYAPFGIGVFLLGLAPFGQELNFGTFSVFLAQPASRRRLWTIKTSVLAVALFTVFAALCVSNSVRLISVVAGLKATTWKVALDHLGTKTLILKLIDGLCHEVIRDSLQVGGLGVLAAFAGGLWTNLLFRNTSAAFWVTLLAPLGLGFVTGNLGRPMGIGDILLTVTIVVYSALGFVWAKRHFLRVEDTQGLGSAAFLQGGFVSESVSSTSTLFKKRRPIAVLIRKELQLQQVNLLIAGAMVVLHLAALGARAFQFDARNPNNLVSQTLNFWWILWFAMPLLIGGTTVAEERKFGMLENHLCLPVSRRIQFALKFVLALIVGTFLGGVVPWLIEMVGAAVGVPGSFPTTGVPEFWFGLKLFCLTAAGLSVAAFYASTLTRNLLQAIGAAVVVAIVFTALGQWSINGGGCYVKGIQIWQGPLFVYVCALALTGALLWTGFGNFGRLSVNGRLWLRNLASISAALIFAFAATGFAYQRVWELAMPLEPRHGPAEIRGHIEPKIRFSGDKAFVLLSDGRLWEGNQYALTSLGWEHYADYSADGANHGRPVRVYLPTQGAFVGQSNWIDLAASYRRAFAVKADGTMWNLFTKAAYSEYSTTELSTITPPERIGNASDWASVAASYGFVLGLKTNGTIWGWHFSDGGQLAPVTDVSTENWIQLGPDTDWRKICVNEGPLCGIKTDGSIWKWGNIWMSKTNDLEGKGKTTSKSSHHGPTRSRFENGAWQSVHSSYWGIDLAVREDGVLFVEGGSPVTVNILGHLYKPNQIAIPPPRVNGPEWAGVAMYSRTLVALKKDGTLYENALNRRRTPWGGTVWKPSHYSDWIAVQCQWNSLFAALAADGTLSFWQDPWTQAEYKEPFGPSRKPLLSLNIFAASSSHHQ